MGQINIVASDAVKGQITVRLRRVPWEVALRAILRAKGLSMVREGNVVRVDRGGGAP